MKLLNVIKPQYTFAKVIPNHSIRNNNTHLIAKTISSLHTPLLSKFEVSERKTVKFFNKEITLNTKYNYHLSGKVSYFVYMEKNKIEFYFIFPESLSQVIKERLTNVWSHLTIEFIQEKDVPFFSEKCTKYQLNYVKEDGLSLRTDRGNNFLLNSTLNAVDMLEDGDKIGILYNFIPTSQESFRHSYRHTIEKFKKGAPTERNKVGFSFLAKSLISFVDSIIKDITEVVAGKNAKISNENVLNTLLDKMNGGRQLSESSQKKGRADILESQIVVFAESKVKVKERNYVTSITDAFDVIAEDNSFTRAATKSKFDLKDTRFSGVAVNKVSEEEVQNFISLPGRDLIEKYPFMEKVDTLETPIPEELQKGVMCIGQSIYRGHKQKAYLSNDEQFKKLMLLLIGPTRAGKSKLIANLSKNAIDHDECVIIFDFIKKCELSDEVAACFPKDKVLEISCDDFENLQGIGYNEVGYTKDAFKQYENAKRQTSNTLALINTINDNGEGSRLSPKMERYLESACLVVYISNGSMKDVFSVLLNHEVRHEYIAKITPRHHDYLDEYVASLNELDEKSRDGEVVGTKIQAGIIDRLNALKRNTYIELMLKKSTENNINLVEEMQKNQLIVIKMPQNMFTTDAEKDVFTTYWITKIWLALQVRADIFEEKDYKKVNLVIDEVYQIEHTEKFLENKLSQIAKFGLKPIISCHYINQLKHLREELRSANAFYMLIAGCDKKNFNELKEELYPYTAEDLRNLKRYHSLNYIKTKDGYAQFITKLPPPLNERDI